MFEPEVIKKLLNPRNLESLKLSKVDLEAMELYEDLGGKFTRYLYRCKAENGQEWLVEIPKTSCPVKTNELPNFDTYPEWSTSIPEPKTSMDTVGTTFLHLGTPKYIKLTNKYQQEAIVVKVIKEPIKEMTLAEVEEKLGYKVKIISGENKN